MFSGIRVQGLGFRVEGFVFLGLGLGKCNGNWGYREFIGAL